VRRLLRTGPPDRELSRRRYDRLAATYERQLGFRSVLEPVRARAVILLRLRSGDTVLDVGCGTGASLALLVEAVGPAGRVVGVEQSGEMLARCRQRVQAEDWQNVTLIEAPAEEAVLPAADAALFFFTHDLMRSPTALTNVLRAVRPGGRVVAAGGQRGRWWFAPVGLAGWFAARRYVTTLDGITRPWSLLAPRLVDLEIESLVFGFVYLARGRLPGAPSPCED
jgi:ubiquinone/menaquinone biosynthesis C-methylase UbiE